eukprot:255992-Ditylum_brightwellii.AAC.1
MQETNINWKKNNAYDRVRKLFTRAWNNIKLQTSKYKENTRTTYQSGGTALGLTGKHVSKVCDSGSNHMGRWSWITIKGEKSQKINFYQLTEYVKTHLLKQDLKPDGCSSGKR